MARIRIKQGGFITGREVRDAPYNDTKSDTLPSEYSKCSDFVGNIKGDNSLTIESRKSYGSITNGTKYPGHPFHWSNWPSWYWYTYNGIYPRINLSASDYTMYTTDLLAKTNPSRPTMNLPAFIGELKDLPEMFRHAGRLLLGIGGSRRNPRLTLAQEGAAAYLAYNFGWAPLLSDLKNLCLFANGVQKRTLELQRLYSKGGLKRRIELDHGQSAVSGKWTLQSNDLFIDPIVYSTRQFKVWGSVRWLPTGLPPKKLESVATRAYYGLNAGNITTAIWELLPWSWFIDYMTNTQTYLIAKQNFVGASPTRVNLMRHTTYKHAHDTIHHSPNLKTESGFMVCELKERFPRKNPTVGVQFRMPFLSGKQLGILASLLMMRVKP